MHATDTLPEGCTGYVYAVNPSAPDEGRDVAHDIACPAHPDATLVCPWCFRPTVADRPHRTRGYVVGGKERGELCPSCTDESRAIDADAAAYSPDPRS